MASLAKDSLSPLIKSASARRRSLELCQQIGSQLLSPSTLTALFSPDKKSPSPTKSEGSCASHSHSSNAGSGSPSPFKTVQDARSLFNYNLSESTSTNYHYKRRASDSLWVDTFPKVGSLVGKDGESKGSRSCLTPQPLDKVFDEVWDEPREKLKKPVVECNIIPPTPAEKATVQAKEIRPIDFSLNLLSLESDEDEEDKENTDSAEDNFRTVSEKHDVDGNLMKYAKLKWNLVLKPEELLGKGSFGVVVPGIHKGQEVAVKVLKTTNAQKRASLLGEENVLKLPFHNHIVRTMNIYRIEPDKALIVMEKMHKGSLLHLLNDSSFEVSCSMAINFSKQIALALMFCHRQGLLHLDVKPQNILVDLHNCCKLSDFGSSKYIKDLSTSHKYTQLEGTIPYTSPELFRGSKPTEKCDVYSFAITMWQILTREMPYEDENEHAVIFRVVSQGLRPERVEDANNNHWSTFAGEEENLLIIKYTELYKKAWHSNPDLRPTMEDIHKCLIEIQLHAIA